MSNRVAHVTETIHNNISIDNCYNYAKNIRILAVDDNPVCLKLLSVVLEKCGYQFTAMSGAREAYEVLKKNRDSYDIVLSDVKNNMGEFKLLDLIKLEMDIPVILLSADDGKDSVSKGIDHGAQDYLVKPISCEEIKIICLHVARKEHYRSTKISHDIVKTNPNPVPSLKRQKGKISKSEGEIEGRADGENKKALSKRPRVQWTLEMKEKFERAIEELGVENAVPMKIRELMNEPTLTRNNIASHLQKHRNNLHNAKEMEKKNTQACVNAMRSLYRPSTLACSKDQCIECLSLKNMSVQRSATDTNLSSFAANIRTISSTMNPQDTLPENNQQISRMSNQMSSALVNNHMTGWSAATANPNQDFRAQQKEDGTRFVSFYPRPTTMENNCNRSYSCFSSGYNPSGGQFQGPQSSNSLPMLPPSYSYGPVQIPGSIQPTQMAQPTNSRAMLPPSSSYGPMHMLGSTQSMAQLTNYRPMILPSSSYGPIQMPGSTQPTQMTQPTNFLPMLPPSSSYGPSQIRGSTQSSQTARPVNSLPPSSSNGQLEKQNPIDTQEGSTESSICDLEDIDQFLNSEFEFDFPFNYLDDDLLSIPSQFDDDSAPNLSMGTNFNSQK